MAEPLISIAEARQRVLDAAERLPTEDLGVEDALDRVLAADIRAAGDVPPFACSAMDGYAIIAAAQNGPLTVVGESRAGTPSTHRLAPQEAIRISTGAAVPAGATAVVRQEDITLVDGAIDGPTDVPTTIEIDHAVEAGANIREPGEDMRAGAPVLR